MRRDRVGKRYKLLIKLINKRGYTIGAEIGCAKGNTTYRLLKYCPKLRLYAVDLWGIVPDEIGGGSMYRDWNFRKIKNTFDKVTHPYKRRLTILQGVSWQMAKKVSDNSLDFIFIDADHEYESVKKDIRAWTPKLKKGGMLSGHDYDFPDVERALNELIPNWIASGIDDVWLAKKEDLIINNNG